MIRACNTMLYHRYITWGLWMCGATMYNHMHITVKNRVCRCSLCRWCKKHPLSIMCSRYTHEYLFYNLSFKVETLVIHSAWCTYIQGSENMRLMPTHIYNWSALSSTRSESLKPPSITRMAIILSYLCLLYKYWRQGFVMPHLPIISMPSAINANSKAYCPV